MAISSLKSLSADPNAISSGDSIVLTYIAFCNGNTPNVRAVYSSGGCTLSPNTFVNDLFNGENIQDCQTIITSNSAGGIVQIKLDLNGFVTFTNVEIRALTHANVMASLALMSVVSVGEFENLKDAQGKIIFSNRKNIYSALRNDFSYDNSLKVWVKS